MNIIYPIGLRKKIIVGINELCKNDIALSFATGIPEHILIVRVSTLQLFSGAWHYGGGIFPCGEYFKILIIIKKKYIYNTYDT